MTEEIMPTLELSVEQGCYRATVRAESWLEVLSRARVAGVKMRIAEEACRETIYDFTEERWRIIIPKHIGVIRNRIALALFLVFPERISRNDLSVLSSVQMGSLNNYLTKLEYEVQPHVDENEEGIRLNAPGYKWASGILNSTRRQDDAQGDDQDAEGREV